MIQKHLLESNSILIKAVYINTANFFEEPNPHFLIL